MDRRGWEWSLLRKPKERAAYFWGGLGVIAEDLRSQGHRGGEAGRVKQQEGAGFGEVTIGSVGGTGLETLLEGRESV